MSSEDYLQLYSVTKILYLLGLNAYPDHAMTHTEKTMLRIQEMDEDSVQAEGKDTGNKLNDSSKDLPTQSFLGRKKFPWP